MSALGSLWRLLEKRFDFLNTFHAVGSSETDELAGVSGLEQQVGYQRSACRGPGTRRYTEYPKKCTNRRWHLMQKLHGNVVQRLAGGDGQCADRPEGLRFDFLGRRQGEQVVDAFE